MFVLSVKADRRKICVILAVALLVVTGAIVLARVRGASTSAAAVGGKYSLSAATNEERVSFLSQFGWKVDAKPIENKEITIPAKFNDVYDNYNKIQKDQGLDLTMYAGKVCKQWVYAVTNYPQNPDVRATLLVYDNQVIGGDLSTTELDGFMTGFFGEQASHDTLTKSSSSASAKSSSGKAASALISSKLASSKENSSTASKPTASKPTASKSASSKSAASSKKNSKTVSAVEAKPKASSTVPANAWPTD